MKSMKKLFAVVLSIALIVSCFAISASAAVTQYPVWVQGVRVTGANENNVLGDGKVSYDAATQTLTLNNATINAASFDDADFDTSGYKGITEYGIAAKCDLTIELIGSNKIIATEHTSKSIQYGIATKVYGLPEDYVLIIKGKDGGSLDIEYVDQSLSVYPIRYGIYTDYAEVHSANITAKAIPFGEFRYALTIKDSDIKVSDIANFDAIYISYGAPTDMCKILGDSSLTITNAQRGISAGGKVTIADNSKVDITSSDYAITAFSSEIVFSDKVNVNCVTTGDYDCIAAPDISFDMSPGGKVTVETKATTASKAAVKAISGSTIVLSDGNKITYPDGGKEVNMGSYWIVTQSDLSTPAKKVIVECPLIEYEMDDATWTKGSTDGQKITSSADFSKFVSVSVDDKVVDAANYTKAEGSTIITFKPAYLETLSVGKHTVVITSTDGTATGYLTIKEAVTPTPEKKAEEEKVANTADNNAIGAFVALSAFAAAGFVSLKKKED